MTLKIHFTKKEHADSGLAFLLITLLVYFRYKQHFMIDIAFVELLVVMILPVMFLPFTFLWLNLSDLLGKFMSRMILTVIFFVVVFPVAMFRRFLRKDSLKLKMFKKDNDSVFYERNHCYSKDDFITPY